MNDKSILIVEDDFVLAQNTKYILLTVGYNNISIASNTKVAIEAIKKSLPSIILMDVDLSEEVDGISLAAQIQKEYSIPIIFLISNFDSSSIDRINTSSPFSYISKPVDAQELKITIEILLHKYSLERELLEQKNSLTQAFNAISDGIITVDGNGLITFLNDTARKMFNLDSSYESELFLSLYNKYVKSKNHHLPSSFWSNHTDKFNEIEAEFSINSTQFIFHTKVERIQSSNHSSFIITIKDITTSKKEEESRKLAEESLRLNERKFFDLVNNLPLSITRFIIESNTYEFSNNAFEEQFGASIDVLRNLTPAERLAYIHEEDLSSVMEGFKKWSSENYKGVMTLDYKGYKYNKDHLWLKNFLYADFDEQNKPYALTQIGVDVSNLKNAEIALTKALRNDFRTTVQNLLNLVIRIRKDKKSYIVMFCEGILANELGLASENEIPLSKHFDITLRKALQPSIEYCFTGKSVQNEMYFNNRYILFWFQPIVVDDITTEIVGSAVDITIQKEVQHKLRESEQLQRMLIELLPIGVIQYSYYNNNAQESFVFERTNPVLLQLLNIGSIELLHRNVIRERMSDLSFPSYNQQVQLWDSKNDGSLFKMNVQFKSNNPSEVQWVQIHQTKYQISDYQSRYICVLIDISKEKYDEIRLKHLASFAEQTPMIIVEFDVDKNSFYVNPYAIERFPTIESEGIMHAIFQSIDLKKITSFPKTVETELNGIVFEQTVFNIPDSNIYRIFSYEITSRKEIERELIKTLEKERELVSLQNQFVTTVSHEFRTPLTGILTSCELIEMYSQKMTQEKLNNEISKIKSRVEDLTKLMNNFIVQSSKLGLKERFNPQLHEFNNFVERVIEDNQQTLQNKNIHVSYSTELDTNYVLIDESMIRHSIQNVLSNAIMYSPSKSEISVSILSTKNQIILKVSDHGIGIPSDEIDFIFSPFFRATNTSNISGSGLGLSLAKEFIEINNGNISVESTIGKGTTVTIILESKTQSVLNA